MQIFGLDADLVGDEMLDTAASNPPHEIVRSMRDIAGIGGFLSSLAAVQGNAALGIDHRAIRRNKAQARR